MSGRIPLLLMAILILPSCAHRRIAEGVGADALLKEACAPGAAVTEVTGSVWLKAESAEKSGQFPATVRAEAPSILKMEVTDLLGGTQA